MAPTQVALASLEERGVHIPCSYRVRKCECARTARLRGAPAHIHGARSRLAGEGLQVASTPTGLPNAHGPTEHGEPWHEHDAQKTEPLCQSSPVVLGFAQRAARRGSAFLVSTTETAGPISLLTNSSELSCCAALAR